MLILGYKHPSKIANTIVTKKKKDQPGSESKCCHLYPDWGQPKLPYAEKWMVYNSHVTREADGGE
jgi:hypothetical protein